MSPNEVRGRSTPRSGPSRSKPSLEAPANTPVARRTLASRACGQYPASSIAFQHSWRKIRCWGSVFRASCSDIPKNSASNWSKSSRNPPHLEWLLLMTSMPCGSGV